MYLWHFLNHTFNMISNWPLPALITLSGYCWLEEEKKKSLWTTFSGWQMLYAASNQPYWIVKTDVVCSMSFSVNEVGARGGHVVWNAWVDFCMANAWFRWVDLEFLFWKSSANVTFSHPKIVKEECVCLAWVMWGSKINAFLSYPVYIQDTLFKDQKAMSRYWF